MNTLAFGTPEEGGVARPCVAVVQDGARLQYAVPRALKAAGMLEMMFAEWYVRPRSWAGLAAWLAAKVRPGVGRRMRERCHPDLTGTRIVTNPGLVLRQEIARKMHPFIESYYAWSSERVGAWIQRRGLGNANALFGFVRNIDPALCETSRQSGLRVVTDQMIAPMAEEERQAQLQMERWSGWQAMTPPAGAALVRRIEERTWAASDHITCASEYVRHELLKQGVSPDRISVAPYPVDVTNYAFADRRGRSANGAPPVVGFVGAVGLRKGAPWFFEVARRFEPGQARFVMVGPIHLQPGVADRHKGDVELAGAVPRSEVIRWLERFDILLFPSTCEGSPTAVAEAMASGLPVVCTPNSGTLLREGQDGFIRPYDDVDGLAEAVDRLVSDAALRVEMGRQARERAETFTLAAYSASLATIFTWVMQQRHGGK
jgi:hypothetical protein